MINDKAKKLLGVNNPEEFKLFSRKALVYNRIEECTEYQINENQIQRNIFEQLKLHQKSFKQKKTLENKIIQIFKKNLSNYHKDMASYNLLKENINHPKQKGNSSDVNDDTINHQPNGLFYALCRMSEGQAFQKLSIKASVFQNQTDHYCCLVIEEFNDQQRIKILQKVTQENKYNFFQFCLYLGDKLQNIVQNIDNQRIIQANVLQCYNKIYNYKDQAKIIKNQFSKSFQNLKVTQLSLGDLKEQIISRFNDKVKEIDIQISYIKCNSQTLINTQVDKLIQLLSNLIENSIQFQAKVKKNSIQRQNYSISQKDQYNLNQTQNLNSNNLDVQSYNQLSNQQKFNHEIQIFEEDSKSSFGQQYSDSSNNFDEFDFRNFALDSNQIKIKFELLLGEQEASNIMKVTVKDNGIGMSLESIFKLFQIINTKNIDFSPQFQNNSYLGWKVNYHIIGNLGPFYNFFVQSQENQGLEYHFYIFQDIQILKQDNREQQMVFKNHQFEISLEQSNKNYQNFNKIEEINDQVQRQSNLTHFLNRNFRKISNQFTEQSLHRSLHFKKQLNYQEITNLQKLNSKQNNKNTDSLIQSCSNNTQNMYKFIKDKVKLNNNFRNNKMSQYS
ncbi:hypothetical protein ABPG74_008765 [Tetrahymena malaccensis]